MPYRLFALSNFASLLALLGFPVLLEPWFDLVELGWGWSALYVVFVGVCAATGWASLRAAAATEGDPVPAGASAPTAAAPPAVRTQLTWLALSAMGSVMLLAVTNHVTQNIASVPFLWVLPLSIYLLTFILTFDHPRWYQRWFFVIALAGLVPAMAYLIPSLDLKLAVTVFFVGLFVACMFCHGELARMKPDPRYLTRFYLMLSVGGALGAVLVAIVAPLTLPGYFEVNVALVLLALLVLVQLGGWTRLVGVAVVAATGYFAVQGAQEYARDTRVMWRDFYGVVRTRDRGEPVPYRSMLHGGIVHGGQLLGDAFRNTPSDYFGPGSGYGRLFAALNERPPGAAQRRDHRAGRRRGRVVRPRGRHLRLLRDQPARGRRGERRVHLPEATRRRRPSVVLGDGRLSLEREAPRRYDVLGIDAFAGDSIPMHLVTREAMALYVRHLADDGVIVFQATNRYIDLLPVVKRLASEFGLEAVVVSDQPNYTERRRVLAVLDRPDPRHARPEAARPSGAARRGQPDRRPAGPSDLHRRAPQPVPHPQVAMTADPIALMRASFDAAVAAADPLKILGEHLPPRPRGKVVVVGAGKAAASMAVAVERAWPDVPMEGVVITRYAHGLPTQRIRVVEAGHPVPDEAGEAAAHEILRRAQQAGRTTCCSSSSPAAAPAC